MQLIILGGGVLLLLLLIARWKLNAFLALVITSFAVAFANRMSPEAALKSVIKGIGDTMGSIALIIVFGAMLGKLIEESGAAHSICRSFIAWFGKRRIQAAVLVTGFLVGLPMIYNAAFLVLIPLVYTLSSTTGLPLLYLGIALSSALSVTHGYLPPHPAPTAIAAMYKADVNLTLLYGLVLAVPAIILGGPVLAHFYRKVRSIPPPELYTPREFSAEELPGFGVSIFTTLVPMLLILAGALVRHPVVRFLSDPNIALLLAVFVGMYTLGLARGRSMENLMKSMASGAAGVSMILFIIASGGAFKQVLLDCGTGKAIETFMATLHLNPILLAWSAAALLRLSVGSATVAAITAAGIVLPVVPNCGVAPELLVLATAAGSIMFSHFNDTGFWMFKEYYNVSVRQTLAIWSVMEIIIGVAGLIGVFALHALVGAPQKQAVFYVNSYHQGYASSDEAMAELRREFAKAGVPIEVRFLDAKRDPAVEAIERRAAVIAEEIRTRKPALLVASDDDAVKYVVVPYFKNGPMPIVFCGVNWSADQYGLPPKVVTGMIEVVPIVETIEAVRSSVAGIRRIRTLSEDSTSERSNRMLLEPKYRGLGLEPSAVLVSTFEDWKREFLRAQQEADLIYVPTNGAIRGWNKDEARAFIRSNIRRPVITCDDFMMPYAVFGLTKIAAEQGEWAASAALSILRGAAPASIPIARNTRTRCFHNPALAGQIGFRLSPERSAGCEAVE